MPTAWAMNAQAVGNKCPRPWALSGTPVSTRRKGVHKFTHHSDDPKITYIQFESVSQCRHSNHFIAIRHAPRPPQAT